MVNLVDPVTTTLPAWLAVLQELAPVLAFVIAALAIIPAWVAIAKNAKSNRQGHWWREVQWALDSAFSDNPAKQKAGIQVIDILSNEAWLGRHELLVLDSAWEQLLEQPGKPSDGTEPLRHKELTGPSSKAYPPDVRAAQAASNETRGTVQAEAAKLKLTLDERLRRETPDWVKALAKGQ